jgi:hypothetical protein
MRRLLMLMTLAAIAAGCRTTPAPQPCCRPAYNPCNPCSQCGSVTTMGAPVVTGPAIESYGTPTFQSGPTVVSPAPQSYAPTTN